MGFVGELLGHGDAAEETGGLQLVDVRHLFDFRCELSEDEVVGQERGTGPLFPFAQKANELHAVAVVYIFVEGEEVQYLVELEVLDGRS